MRRLFSVFVLASMVACGYLTGPEGEQGPPGPAYPTHSQWGLSGTVWQDDAEPAWHGIQFDASAHWYGITANDTSLYDILFTIDYDNPERVTITAGNNPYTEIYLLESALSLRAITSLPAQTQKRNVIVYEESDSPVYLLVRNRNNRWAKAKISDQYWEQYYYSPGDVYYYYYWLLVEAYYYKDAAPDLTLHKRL
jgi:hypothetical protein